MGQVHGPHFEEQYWYLRGGSPMKSPTPADSTPCNEQGKATHWGRTCDFSIYIIYTVCFIKAFICAAGARADACVVFFGVCVLVCLCVCVPEIVQHLYRDVYINFLALILLIERDILSKEV